MIYKGNSSNALFLVVRVGDDLFIVCTSGASRMRWAVEEHASNILKGVVDVSKVSVGKGWEDLPPSMKSPIDYGVGA